jgi:osmoprotectant transport system permease protein
VRRLGLRNVVTPLVLVAIALAILWWVDQADLDAGERAVLETSNLRDRAWEHVKMSAVSTGLAALVAVPLGILVSRRALRRAGTPVLFVANIGQTVPTVAVLALMLTVTGLGFRTAVFALWIYSLLPILQNTLVGLRGVDPATVEAARGMGMSPMTLLLRVELPLALPVVMAGIRTAAVVNVGTAALGTFIGAGGMGAIIEIGINNQRDVLLYVGAGLTALLALAADWVVGVVAALVSPRHTQAAG